MRCEPGPASATALSAFQLRSKDRVQGGNLCYGENRKTGWNLKWSFALFDATYWYGQCRLIARLNSQCIFTNARGAPRPLPTAKRSRGRLRPRDPQWRNGRVHTSTHPLLATSVNTAGRPAQDSSRNRIGTVIRTGTFFPLGDRAGKKYARRTLASAASSRRW